MTMLRRVLAIVTRSFYHANRRYIKSITKQHHKRVSLYSTSSRLTQHQSRGCSTSTRTKTPPVITIEHHQSSKSFSRKQFIWIAAVTTLSYIGYKYYFYDDKAEKPDPDKPNIKRAIFTTAQQMIENTLINRNMAFRLGVFMDGRKRYNRALYFYKLYLKRPNTKKGEYAALNNLIIIYYRLNEYENALIAFELIGKQQTKERNLEFIKAHCHHSLRQYREAISFYIKYLDNSASFKDSKSDVTATYNNLALLYYEIGEYNKAYEYFEKLGENEIREKRYSFRFAHCLQHMDEFEKSLQYYNEYLHNISDTEIEEINLQNTYHNVAVLLYDNGKYEDALKMFTKLSTDELSKRNLEFKMAHTYAIVGDRTGAIEYLHKCSEKEHVYGEYAIICKGLMAQVLYEDGQYEKAVDIFNILGENEIIKQDLYYSAAFSYFKCGEYAKSLKYYMFLIENNVDKLSEDEIAFIYCRIALVYYKMNEFNSCLSVFSDELSDDDITNWNMEFIVAHSHHKLAQYDSAKEYYLRFLSSSVSDADDIMNCYHNLALLCYDSHLYSESVTYFELLNEKEIMDRNLEFFAAFCYSQIDEDDEANEKCIKYYRKCLVKYENDDVYDNLGCVYYKMGKYKDAIDVFSLLTETEMISRNLCLKLSECYSAIGDDELANKYGEKYRKNENKKNIEMAIMYYHLFDNEMAIKMWRKVSDEDICEHNAEFVAAHCYQLYGDHVNAIKYYHFGFKNSDNLSDIDDRNRAHHNLGCAYHDIGEYENAIECFSQLNEEHITATNIEFIIGVAYHNLNQKENALRYYVKFLANPMSETQNDQESIVSCYNNLVMLYYYHFHDYESAWNIVHNLMDEEQICHKNLELETANCAHKLNENCESIKYYKLFVKNMEKSDQSDQSDQSDDDIIYNVYQNMAQIYQENADLDQNGFAKLKKQENHYNKQQTLKLFVQWIRNHPNNER